MPGGQAYRTDPKASMQGIGRKVDRSCWGADQRRPSLTLARGLGGGAVWADRLSEWRLGDDPSRSSVLGAVTAKSDQSLGPRPELDRAARTAIVYIVGARPNFVKMAPVVREMRARVPNIAHLVIHTGQHYDAEMSGIFFQELGLPKPDHLLGVGSGRHGYQTARALERIEAVLEEIQPVAVVVPGDVNSTLAAALAAAKLQIPLAHLEAGLRSFDRTMPEEINRVLVDQVAQWCFIHSHEAQHHLQREGIPNDRIRFVGNTMIDTLVQLGHNQQVLDSPQARTRPPALPAGYAASPRPGRWPTATLGDRRARRDRSRAARSVSSSPADARPFAARDDRGAGIRFIDPVGYIDFLALETSAAGVLTD